MPSPLRAAVFDIGMVMLRFDFGLTARRLAPRCRVPAASLPSMFWNSGLVDDYDRGRISCEAFAAEAARRVGFTGTTGELLEAWSDIFEPIPPMFERVRRWKARGLPLYLLSNTCEAHVRWFTARWEVFREFSGAIYSCRVGALKPEPGIYRSLFSTYGIDPASALFIDDRAENVEAARALGMKAFQYRDEPGLVAELRLLGLD